MAELTILQNGKRAVIPFSGQPVLSDLLQNEGFLLPHPCGGRGTCGKCVVDIEGAVSEPNDAERRIGKRLSCQARLLGDATVYLTDTSHSEQIETSIGCITEELFPMQGQYGAAVDIGTTTVAVKVFNLETGECVGESASRNPQTAVAADVMGRIEAACKDGGGFLQSSIQRCIGTLLKEAAGNTVSLDKIDSVVLTGNTTMLYLLTGMNPEPLSHAPFYAEHLFGTELEILGRHAYLPPCMDAFVGADITCAVLASKMCHTGEIALLCDVGTNGEMALWKDGRLYVASTAAGPAFEGAGISCGCGSIQGAIDRVWLEGEQLRVHSIGDKEPVGICGSGLIDAIAAGLESGCIDETGALEEEVFPISGTVQLMKRDIRAVQLAKAAIAAGIATLTETAGISLDDIQTLYIAGGFGSHLNVESAAAIGLIPDVLKDRVDILGNASLAGAVSALLDTHQWQNLSAIASSSSRVDLGGNPRFNEHYIDHMLFE